MATLDKPAPTADQLVVDMKELAEGFAAAIDALDTAEETEARDDAVAVYNKFFEPNLSFE